ncbi:MAG TPA: OmpH family outer membrane protein [Ferruginibacter sp.]|nr:OmpH family outer membrane protein [Ferruginibacter sp.]HMP19811.1 OmpH family outer membrane protein [Ferruginibacter sp.]
MKHLLTATFVMIFSVLGLMDAATAQTKIGYISTEELIGSMPEAEKANGQLQDYQTSLQEQGNEYLRELSEKDSVFQADSSKYSQATKELKRNDLIALYQKVQGWNQTMQQLLQQKTQELLVPLRSKAFEAIKAVAKESGYAYVLDESAILVGPPGDDLLPLVKKKLGIKEKTAPAATGPAGAKPKQ